VLTFADEHRCDLWDPAAEDLLAALMLAVGSSGHTCTMSPDGSTNPPFPPRRTARPTLVGCHGRLASRRHLPDGADCGQGAGLPADHGLVTPPARGVLPAFDPAAFATSRDTVYLLSNLDRQPPR